MDIALLQEKLIPMIVVTESMSEKERNYWLDILPYLNEDHLQSLYDILDTEKRKLEELEVEFNTYH